MPERVSVFVDGANVYRAFRAALGSARYSPLKLAAELARGRQLIRTSFYIAAVPQQMGAQLYADQQRFPRPSAKCAASGGWWRTPCLGSGARGTSYVIPPEIWNRVGNKLIPKLRTGEGLEVSVGLTVTVARSQRGHFLVEVRQILSDLGLVDKVRAVDVEP